MKNSGRRLRTAITITLLIFSISGCGSAKSSIVLKDREQIHPHPMDPEKVCLDKGYLIEIFEELGK